MEIQAQETIGNTRQALKAKIQIYDKDAHVIETDDDLRPLMPEPCRNKQGRFSAWMSGMCVYGAGRARPAIWRNVYR